MIGAHHCRSTALEPPEREQEQISAMVMDPDLRDKALEELEARHRERRDPYLQRLSWMATASSPGARAASCTCGRAPDAIGPRTSQQSEPRWRDFRSRASSLTARRCACWRMVVRTSTPCVRVMAAKTLASLPTACSALTARISASSRCTSAA